MVLFDYTIVVSVFGRRLYVDIQVVRQGGIFVGLGFWVEKVDVQ